MLQIDEIIKVTSSWVVITVLVLATSELRGGIVTGPYFQAVDSQGITIMWESNLSTTGTVEYGQGSSFDKSSTATSERTGGNTYVYKARIDNLNSGEEYDFRVVDGGVASDNGTFKTAPTTGKSSFKIGIWGDTHFPSPGDKIVTHMIEESRIDLGANHGDISQQDGCIYYDLTKSFLPLSVETVGKSVPFFSAFGNHDVTEEGNVDAEIRKFVDHPTTVNSSPSDRRGSYLTMYDDVALIFIDWNRMAHDLPQGEWFEQTLQSELVQNARFTFVFIHRAPYYERWKVAEHWVVKNNLPLLCEKYGVNAVYSGHMHGYERGQKNGTTYITNGCGSYLDVSEPVDTNYAHITQGAWENTPVGFNYGLVNGYTTIEIRDSLAISRFNAFDKNGDFMGVLDSVVMVDEQWENDGELLYSLTVENGSGNGDFGSGEMVTITADIAPEGKIFSHWSGTEGAVKDSTAEETVLTMPSKDLTVIAHYNEHSDIDTANLSENLIKWADWQAMQDSYGSSASVSVAENSIEGSLSLVPDNPELNEYSWSKVSAYFEGEMNSVTLIKVTYTSDGVFNITLDQEILADNGASYSATLEAGENRTVYLPVDEFTQNRWEGFPDSLNRELSLSEVSSVSFETGEEENCNFTITELKFTNYDIAETALKKSTKSIKQITGLRAVKAGLLLSLPVEGNFRVRIYGVNGRVYYNSVHTFGNNEVSIPIHLSSGVHLISITGANEKLVHKFVIN